MKREWGILLALLAIGVITTIIAPRFCLDYNLTNLLQRTALGGLLAVGVSFVIISGGIDLSIGSVVGLVGTLLPWMLVKQGVPVFPAVALVLVAAAAIGLIHGLLITQLKLQPFVVTLCGLLVWRGMARWITHDDAIGFGRRFDDGLRRLVTARPFELPVPGIPWVAEGHFGRVKVSPATGEWIRDVQGDPIPLPFWGSVPIPLPFLILLGVAILAAVVHGRTVFGRHLQALGSNEAAARFSGVRTHRVTTMAYVICSVLAGVAGVLFALDVNTVEPGNHGNFYELYAIAAVVLGGCSLRGGEGSIFGAVVGTAVVQVLYNASNLVGIPKELELVNVGLVLLLAVVADTTVRRVLRQRRLQHASRETTAPTGS